MHFGEKNLTASQVEVFIPSKNVSIGESQREPAVYEIADCILGDSQGTFWLCVFYFLRDTCDALSSWPTVRCWLLCCVAFSLQPRAGRPGAAAPLRRKREAQVTCTFFYT